MKLNEKTKAAFYNWISKWGATYNQSDIDCFNEFALLYCKDNDNNITKDEFVKEVKKYTHTSVTQNRGIAQKYYKRLEIIQSFCKSNKLLNL